MQSKYSHRNLKSAFNKAIVWGYIRESPFTKVKIPKLQKNKPEFIKEDELELICSEINNVTIRNAARFAFFTGVRVGELVNIRWSNIDLKKKQLTVGDHRYDTKSRKQRIVPLCDKAISNFNRLHMMKDRYVFSKKNLKPYTTDCISKTFKRACRRAGISERITFHTLRHSFASYLAQRGASSYVLKELLGHSSTTVSEIYSHMNEDVLRKAIDKFD
jgi:integrase